MSALQPNKSFRDAVAGDHFNTQLGENLSLEYTNAGVGSNVLAISQMVRGAKANKISSLANEIFLNPNPNFKDIADLLVLIFATRNCRGGKGEKQLAYSLFFCAKQKFPLTALKLLPLFAHYGYWKDLLLISEAAQDGAELPPAAKSTLMECVRIMKEQLVTDIEKSKDDETIHEISLLAKWLPREGSHFDKKLNFVKLLSAEIWPARNKRLYSHYRKTVSRLTSFLELPEVALSARKFDEINFSRVASKATLRLSRVFLNETKNGEIRSHDWKRVRMSELFVEHLTKHGLKGKQLMPHEIVRQILRSGDDISQTREALLDAQWKDLWKHIVHDVKEKARRDGIDFNPTQMVPLCDVSGSMCGVPMEVSIALGIGISEITHPAFQNMVLTFSEEPTWHRLTKTDTIVSKVRSMESANWGMSTNFEAAYDLVLETCLRHKLSYSDVPVMIVFSDMQFNEASGGSNAFTMHDILKKKFKDVAHELSWEETDMKPIVYWNLRNTGGHPIHKDCEGTVMLSGFSASLLSLVMNGEVLKEQEIEVVDDEGNTETKKLKITPEEVLRCMLDDSLYDPVRAVLLESKEIVTN